MQYYYELDTEGAIIGTFDTEPSLPNTSTIIHTTPPPSTMLKPRWIANNWQDTATRTEHETHIDAKTDTAIKQWCLERGKNEEYYINCGIQVAINTIEDPTDLRLRHYKEYRSTVDEQIKQGNTKKKALV